jgi:hypothetical protein
MVAKESGGGDKFGWLEVPSPRLVVAWLLLPQLLDLRI